MYIWQAAGTCQPAKGEVREMAPPQVACRIDAHFYIGGVPCLVVRLSEL
ncbi:hypothetical protein OOU_Y34scaffold00534g84 [Pyricularia oryzae Y34]|uniref:Uncharacterized protein n=2 Tax=Pyricularia oryzae TaxID=318829 RepID=A0AA97NYH9_PYRO3|nr:hypothetical protein OOU_Y34scaffold00534g84 [Pyricularia oryzae Y34]